jgi:hypothetical protein
MDHKVSHSMIRAQRRATICARSRKIGYRTKGKALKFAERSSQISGKDLYVYKCLFCDSWHLTKQIERAKAIA